LHKIKTVNAWGNALNGIDVVINTVGILRQRQGETYEHVHHHVLKTLTQACVKKGVRLVHVSALGLGNPIKSRFSSSKLRGEEVLKNSHADWAIVRPSLVDGDGGYGAKWFQRVAKWPIHFVPANAIGLFAPIDVNDLGQAIASIALRNRQEHSREQRVYELGGNQKVNVIDYLNLLRPNRIKTRALVIKIPAIVARLFAHLCDLVHVTPYSFGHYELLMNNNFPARNRLAEVLGRPATTIGRSDKENTQPTILLTYKAQG